MKFELNDNQLKSLSVFLNRTQLSGAEVQAFIELINVFRKPVVGEDVEKKSD